MEKRITEKQWDEVVVEVTRLAQVREDEDTRRETTKQVLETLNLPVDLLDEALRQVQYREALKRQRQRRYMAIILAIVVAAFLGVGIRLWSLQKSSELEKVTASTARVTRETDNGSNSSSVTRDGNNVFYRVTLQNVPLGQNLPLSCVFTDPMGNIFHQTTWKSRETDHSSWDTFCRCRMPESAPAGKWKVEMKIGDKLVSQSNFSVE